MKKLILVLMIATFGVTYSEDQQIQTQEKNQQQEQPQKDQTQTTTTTISTTTVETSDLLNTTKKPRKVKKITSASYSFNQGGKLKGVDKSTKTKDGYDLNIEFTHNSMNKYIFTGFGTGFSQHPAYTIEKDGVITKDVTFKSIPLYIVVKGYLAPEDYSIRPFVKVVGGYSFNIGQETTQVTDSNGTRMETNTIKDGIYYGGGVGVQLRWLEVSLMETITTYTISENHLKSLRTTLGFAVKI